MHYKDLKPEYTFQLQNNFKNLFHSSNYKHCVLYFRQQLATEHKPIRAQMEYKKQL